MNYTMSWVISRYVLDAMDKRLFEYDLLNSVVAEMDSTLK